MPGIVALGTGYTRIFLLFTPFFMMNYVIMAFVRNDNQPSLAMAGPSREVFPTSCLTIFLCFRSAWG